MSPAPISIAALPFPLAYEVSCRTRTGSVRRASNALADSPLRTLVPPCCSAVRGTNTFGRHL